MNIFFLHADPGICAQYHCDKHVVKMIVESVQLLSTAYHINDPAKATLIRGIYKPTHINHPCAIWARTNANNFQWLLDLARQLCIEYTYRYGKQHASVNIINQMGRYPLTKYPIHKYRSFIPSPQCMPDKYKCDDTIEAYKNYYVGEKSKFAKWNKTRLMPEWYYKMLMKNKLNNWKNLK